MITVKKYRPGDKDALRQWNEFVAAIEKETVVHENLTFSEREAKRKKLEDNPFDWMFEMFPNYAKAEFAEFQKKAIRRILNNMDWYEVLSWSRELSKSTITMMCVLNLVLTGKKKNIILVSDSNDNAVRLLSPYRANLQANQRIKFYYGDQEGFKWRDDEFYTRKGAAFRALGAGQSPRGSKNEDIRPDVIILDDFDTDEDCRNPNIIDKKWNWFEQALYFTRSISEPLLVIWCGNIIAEDCCITRAGEKARELSKLPRKLGNWDIINLRMVKIEKPDPVNDFKYGKSVWPQKNSEEQIDLVQVQVSDSSVQKECYNNPATTGKIFPEMRYGQVPPLHKFRFLISYGDPGTSNKTEVKNSFKSNWLIGIHDDKYYVITGFLERATNATFVEWYYALKTYVKGKTVIYNYIENNSFQDPFYEQVFVPLFMAAAKDNNGVMIGITPDTRKKPDKFSRIEGKLEPLNRFGRLILNEKEKENPHMKRLEKQFKGVNPQLSLPVDGPDSIEGGTWIIDEKNAEMTEDSWKSWGAPKNKHRM